MASETNKNRERTDEGQPRRFSFSLSTAGLVSLVVVCVAALAWTFILGVLVGRGYKPEQAVPQLAEIMPRPGENATAPPKPEGVLRPEELEFFEAVKKQPSQGPGPKVATAPAPKPAATAKAERDAEALADRIAPKKAPKAAPEADQAPDGGERYGYVYQTASLRSRESADAFAERLGKLGFKTSIERAETGSGVWYRVLLHHQGTPESTRAVKDTLKDMGVAKPIMKSKTPL